MGLPRSQMISILLLLLFSSSAVYLLLYYYTDEPREFELKVDFRGKMAKLYEKESAKDDSDPEGRHKAAIRTIELNTLLSLALTSSPESGYFWEISPFSPEEESILRLEGSVLGKQTTKIEEDQTYYETVFDFKAMKIGKVVIHAKFINKEDPNPYLTADITVTVEAPKEQKEEQDQTP